MAIGVGEGTPAISVIIPMYNVRKYIGYAMDSLSIQSLQDFEIILIDDASTDGTYELCQKKYGNDKRVRLLRNDVNSGQWFARNRGIEEARGKYIYFLDADDELLPEALEVMYHTAEAEKADVVHDNVYFMAYTEGRMLPRKTLWIGCNGWEITEGRLVCSRVDRMRWQFMRTMSMPWLHLYRRDFLLEQNIRFVSLPYGEDNVFSLHVALRAENYVRISKMLYIYRGYPKQKARMEAKLPKAFAAAVDNLAALNNIFDECSEEELSFEERMEFIAPWLRAHLRFCVFDIMDTGKKEAFHKVAKYMIPAVGKGNVFAAYMLHLLGDYTHEKAAVLDNMSKQRNDFAGFFAELDQGGSKRSSEYACIQSVARRAVEVEGGDQGYYAKAYEYLGKASLHLGQYEEALEAYGRALEFLEAGSSEYWRIASKKAAILPLLAYTSGELGARLGEYHSALSGMKALPAVRQHGKNTGRIRLGVLSWDFDISKFGVYYGLLFCMDKTKFEVFCYHAGSKEDSYTVFIKDKVEAFVPVSGLSCQETAERISVDGIDVLIDLGGLSQDDMPVLALRPAPVQLAGVASPSMDCVPFVDGFLTDDVISPVGEEASSEKLVRLPCAYCYAMRNDLQPSRYAPVVVKGDVTFGVFASYSLMSDDMLQLWKQILDEVPQGRLQFRSEDFAEQATIVEAAERLHEMGFDMERVIFGVIDEDFALMLLGIDLMLGTYPLLEGEKLLDALYMGVPAVLLYGERPDTRLGLSILVRAGLEDFAVSSKEEYVARAVSLAGNKPLLDMLHKNLRETVENAPAISPVKWVRSLEKTISELL